MTATQQSTHSKRRTINHDEVSQNQSPQPSQNGAASNTSKTRSNGLHQKLNTPTLRSHRTLRTKGDSIKTSDKQAQNKLNQEETQSLKKGAIDQDVKAVLDHSHLGNGSSAETSSTQSITPTTTSAIAAFSKQQAQCQFSPGKYLPSGRESMGAGGGPSSVATLQPHPFNVIISDFQQRRTVANQKKGANVYEFMNTFQGQMKELDQQYYQQKQMFEQQVVQNHLLSVNTSDSDSRQNQLNGLQNIQNQNFDIQEMGDSQNLIPSQPNYPFMMLNEPYENFEFVPNSLQFFYPKQVQRQLQKKKFQNNEKAVQGLKAPTNKHQFRKTIEKMHALTTCQMNFIRVVFQKIDRKSKPIKKQERLVSENLKRKRIYLEQENFDILSVLHNSHTQAQKSMQEAKIQQIQTNQLNAHTQQGVIQSNGHIENTNAFIQTKQQFNDSISDIENRSSEAQDMTQHDDPILVKSKSTCKSPKLQKIIENQNSKKGATIKKTQFQENQISNNDSNHEYQIQLEAQTPSKRNARGANIQTPSSRSKNAGLQLKRATSKKNVKVAQPTYVQAYEKENGSLYMKIMIPEGMSTIDKVTDIEEQNQQISMHYHGETMGVEGQILQDNTDMVHHQQYLFDQQEDHTAPHDGSQVQPSFPHYLEIGQSHSEPVRYGPLNHIMDTMNNVQLMRTVYNPQHMTYRLEEQDNAQKLHCQRAIDFFDYEIDNDHMFYQGFANRHLQMGENLVNGDSQVDLNKDQKMSFYMGGLGTSPDVLQQSHNGMGLDSHMRDELMSQVEPIYDWIGEHTTGPIINNQLINHTSHEDSYFNFDMKI